MTGMSPSGTSLNLLYIDICHPNSASEAQWLRWLTVEHIPALLKARLITRGMAYQEIGFSMKPNPSHPRRYVVLYQTDFKRLQESDEYRRLQEWIDQDKQAVTKQEDNTRNYKLIQEYNPYGISDGPSKNILTVEMNPRDRPDFENWYRTELLPKISKLRGYRRSRRYQLIGAGQGEYLAIHGVDDLSKAFVSQKAHEENSTPRMEKHIEDSNKNEQKGGFVQRGWELVHAEGFARNGTTSYKPDMQSWSATVLVSLAITSIAVYPLLRFWFGRSAKGHGLI